MRTVFTTEAQRHGEEPNRVLAFSRFDSKQLEPLVRLHPEGGKNYENNSLVQVFSVSPCLRGKFSASCKEFPSP